MSYTDLDGLEVSETFKCKVKIISASLFQYICIISSLLRTTVVCFNVHTLNLPNDKYFYLNIPVHF